MTDEKLTIQAPTEAERACPGRREELKVFMAIADLLEPLAPAARERILNAVCGLLEINI